LTTSVSPSGQRTSTHPAKSRITFSRHESGSVFGHLANMRLRRAGSSRIRDRPQPAVDGIRGPGESRARAGLASLPRRQLALRRWCRGLVNRQHAAPHVGLYRRARHRSVRAKHAAIAGKGFEPFAAPFAVVEELAGISRHRLDGLMPAFRASQGRLKLHIGSCFALAKTMERRVVQFHFVIGLYSGSRRTTKRGPFQSSIDRSPTRSSAFLIASASSAQTKGSNPIKWPSRPTV
jgi:hypothetical protein